MTNPSSVAVSRLLLCWLLCLCCWGALGESTSAGEEAAPEQAATMSAGEAKPAPSDEQETEKQKRAMAGLLALCGIAIGGLMFVALVMVWGARLRRMARRELPAQKTLQNELWFLKPPKSPPE